jgi:hypothetical protein
MILIFFYILCIKVLVISNTYAINISDVIISPFKQNQSKIKLNELDFKFEYSVMTHKVHAKFVPNSIEWIRLDDTLLVPRARVEILVDLMPQNLNIKYLNYSHTFQKVNEKQSKIQLYVSLFQSNEISIYHKGKIYSNIIIKNISKTRSKTHLIDYSCYPYHLKIESFDNEYLSLGCKESLTGKAGSEKKILQVFWATSDFKLMDQSPAPYLTTLADDQPAIINVINTQGEIKKIKISATIPDRYHRLRLALGFGPYDYFARNLKQDFDKSSTMAIMLYGKFDLTNEHSLKLFNAYLNEKTTFNNFGVYFSSDIAKIWNNRLVFNTLLGFQGLRFNSPDQTNMSQFIYPQGLEVTLNHPFELKNYKLILGGFISPERNVTYHNLWLRFGKKIFYEINYLSWQQNNNYIRAYGLSIGVPLAKFL